MKISMDVVGNVNEGLLEGRAEAVYDARKNEIDGALRFWKRVPTYDEASASCTSIASVVCSLFSNEVAGARNLSSVCAPNIAGTSEFLMYAVSDQGSAPNVIGSIKQIFEAKIGDAEVSSKTSLSGWYKGPTTITGSPGYAVYLTQKDQNEIEGLYTQELEYIDENGDTSSFYSTARRKYRYDGGDTMPFDEVMNYKLLEVQKEFSSDGEQLTVGFRSSARYVPALMMGNS